MNKLTKVLAFAGLMLFVGGAQAALIQMYNTNLTGGALNSVAEAQAIIDASGGADFSTLSSTINFNGNNFPGAAFGAPPLDRFVMRVTGTLDTSLYSQLLMVHDDGFVVRLGGTDFFQFNNNTAPRLTVSGGLGNLGIVDFEMIFWDQGGAQVAQLTGRNSAGQRVLAQIGNPVPAPATLLLFGLGLAGIGFGRRKKV